MPELCSFDYAVLRVVPRVEREEFVNVGVVLICHTQPFLGALVALDRVRIGAISPDLDLDEVEEQLNLIPKVAAGDKSAGEIAEMSATERFHWLTSPRSTVLQVSPVHSGLSDDPKTTLEKLMDKMVLPPAEIPPPK